jgi:hypothetical protein
MSTWFWNFFFNEVKIFWSPVMGYDYPLVLHSGVTPGLSSSSIMVLNILLPIEEVPTTLCITRPILVVTKQGWVQEMESTEDRINWQHSIQSCQSIKME